MSILLSLQNFYKNKIQRMKNMANVKTDSVIIICFVDGCLKLYIFLYLMSK